MGQGLADQHFHGVIVDDVAALVQDAVLAVAGVGVQGHIGHHAQLGKFFFSARTTRGIDRRGSGLRRRAS
jgi:hypothetical protein